MTKGWTEERRKKAAERARKHKPWEHSTGPRTPGGKARASMNAYKHGRNTNRHREILTLLKLNKDFVRLALQLERTKFLGLQYERLEVIKRIEKQKLDPPPPANREQSDELLS